MPLSIESGVFSDVMPSRINALFAERYAILDRFVERGVVEEGSATALAFTDMSDIDAFIEVGKRPDYVQEARVLHQQVVIDGFKRIFGTEIAKTALRGNSSPQAAPSLFEKPTYQGVLPVTLEGFDMEEALHKIIDLQRGRLELNGEQYDDMDFYTAIPTEVMAVYGDIAVYLEPRYYKQPVDRPAIWKLKVDALPMTIPNQASS